MTDSIYSALRFIDLSELMKRVFHRKTVVLLWKSKGLFPRGICLSSTKRGLLERDASPLDLKRVAQQSNCGG